MSRTNKPHPPGSAEETTEERERRLVEHRVGPEDEARSVPEKPDPQAAPPAAGHGASAGKPPGGT
jgi:hypothetical protein